MPQHLQAHLARPQLPAVAVQGRFDGETFAADVVEVAKKLVPLTVTLWNKVSIKMLPTPAKFHYLFNMRELSKVSPLSGPACGR